MRRRASGHSGPPFAAGLLVAAILAAVALYPPQFASFLDLKVYDSLLRTLPPRPPTGRAVAAVVDEDSLARFGQWPWPRYRIAALLARIREGGARAVAVDMVFAEEDRSSPSAVEREIRRDFGTEAAFSGVPPEARDGDRTLAAALAGGPFVLGYAFDFSGARGDAGALHPGRVALLTVGSGSEAALPEAPGVVANLPPLSAAAGASGFFNVVPDRDGILRRVPMAVRHGGTAYPALALAAFLQSEGGDAVVTVGPGGAESLDAGGKRFPLDRNGSLLVNFRGPRGTIPRVSAGSILDGSAPPEALRGKVVVLGAVAAGLQELRATPLDAAHPGPEIQATVVDNLLAGDPLSIPPWSRGCGFLLALLLGASTSAATARFRAAAGIGSAAAAAVLAWSGSRWLLEAHGTFLSPVLPSAAAILAFSAASSFRFARAERALRRRERKLARTQDAIILSLASLAETRHRETGGHIHRTRHYMRALALELRKNPRYREALDDDTVDLLFRLAPLHDIGKVGVRDSILLKGERLDLAEYEEMKRHTLYGSETIRVAHDFLGGDSFLSMADDIVRTHQERWDGKGYPEGLAGEAIPLAGRLMAVADVYDALVSARGYKSAIPHGEAIAMMVSERGTHFDPDAIDALVAVQEDFRRIAARYRGAGAEPEPPVRP